MGVTPFADQLFALGHAEFVLLVDDDQTEIVELKGLLDQSMRADDQGSGLLSSRGGEGEGPASPCDRRARVGGLPAAGVHQDWHAERFKPQFKIAKMLLGQDFRW